MLTGHKVKIVLKRFKNKESYNEIMESVLFGVPEELYSSGPADPFQGRE